MSDHPLLKFSNLWYCLIEDYSRRGLTRGSDKLIALAGLVQEAIEHANFLRYCAGVWLDIIHTGLCWVVREDEPTASRAAIYRAPTWSWASIDGAVVPVVSYSGWGTQAKHEIRSEVELLSVDMSLAEDGQITSAPIFLRGRLRSARLTQIGGARAPSAFRVANDATDGNSNAKGNGQIYLDPTPLEGENILPVNKDGITSSTENQGATQKFEDHQQHSVTYQLLHVATRKRPFQDNSRKDATTKTLTFNEVLALEPIQGRDGEFVRVGAGEMTFDSWFEKQPIQQIRIF